ncbi:TPA: hypothetical protein MH665_23715 [Klebsiella pneumoniae]|nr:hypothetical protein [Klebsiella pneumoniae]
MLTGRHPAPCNTTKTLGCGLPFRLLQLCLKGRNGKSERSPGKSVARTIRCVFVCYYLECLLSARSSERAFFRHE